MDIALRGTAHRVPPWARGTSLRTDGEASRGLDWTCLCGADTPTGGDAPQEATDGVLATPYLRKHVALVLKAPNGRSSEATSTEGFLIALLPPNCEEGPRLAGIRNLSPYYKLK